MEADLKTDGTLTVFGDIVQLYEDVFCVNGAFRSAPGIRFPCRCTIIRLPDNKLIVYSPFNPSLVDISSLGTVQAIIVPNVVHWTYAHALKDLNPGATMYTSPSLKNRFPDRDWGTVLQDDTSVALAPGLKLICISRLKPFQEIVLFHEPKKTLLVADFAMNLTDHALQVASPGARWYVWLVGTKKLGIGATLESFIRPYCKAALSQVENLLSMDWDTVIPCHGDVVKSGAKEAFRENMFQFMKDSAEKPSSWMMPIGIIVFVAVIAALLYRVAKTST